MGSKVIQFVFACGLALPAGAKVDPVVQDFQKRVDDYVKLHKKLESELPKLKPTESPEEIANHQRELTRRIGEARSGAARGEIFTPEISAQFRRWIAFTMRGHRAKRIRESLRRAEPVRMQLRVNDPYPSSVPLPSTPPSLLLNLPKLPPELDYRVVGHNLVLRDTVANLIVDLIPDAIP